MGDNAQEMLDLLKDEECCEYARALAKTVQTVAATGGKIRIDFSVTDDMKYYSGIVFKGFVKGIPTSVLSGGQYDNLMRKMGKESGAIGFAVYLDLLGELCSVADEYDADVLVLYDAETDAGKLLALTDSLVREGKRIETRREIPERAAYKEIADMRGNR
jgi:ATP phosphoribosyltransferase regulatory subunit